MQTPLHDFPVTDLVRLHDPGCLFSVFPFSPRLRRWPAARPSALDMEQHQKPATEAGERRGQREQVVPRGGVALLFLTHGESLERGWTEPSVRPPAQRILPPACSRPQALSCPASL